MKKEMIKQGLLDKHGKPNDKTPKDYQLASSVTNLSVDAPDTKKIKVEKQEFVIPSDGPEPETPSKRKASEITSPAQEPEGKSKKHKKKSLPVEEAAEPAEGAEAEEEDGGKKKKKKKKKSKTKDEDSD
jgi:H/ACA ribonucleoprotein complex subunit 4